jgi:hypothetical protein
MYTIPELAHLLDTTEEAVRAAASKLGITEDTVKDDYLDSIEREIKDSQQSAIAPVSRPPVKQAASAPIVSIQPDPKIQAQLQAEMQKLEPGAIAPIPSAGEVAPANPTTIAKIELPEDDSRESLTTELEGYFAEGETVADFKLQAMAAGHDIRMRQGMSAIVGRRVNPFGNLGEIKLKTPDFGPVELTNPFVEGA